MLITDRPAFGNAATDYLRKKQREAKAAADAAIDAATRRAREAAARAQAEAQARTDAAKAQADTTRAAVEAEAQRRLAEARAKAEELKQRGEQIISDYSISSLSGLIEQIVVETKYLPPIVIDKPLAGSSRPGMGSKLVKALQPRVSLKVRGQKPIVFRPYGDPVPNEWPTVKFTGLAAGGTLAFLFLRGLLK